MLAGTVFGLVVGYMAAQLGVLPSTAPAVAASRVELGNLYMDAERWDDAIRWYREALAIDASLPDVATDLGACLVSAGRDKEALAALEQALAKDPAHRLARIERARAGAGAGR